jgi:predicted dehydrogenase
MQSVFGQEPVKIAIAGLSHSHVVPLLRNLERRDLRIVGIAESDTALSNRYAKQFNIDKELIYVSLDEMLDKTKPEGVVTFTSIYDHMKVVEACAPRGIHVMVEKPLAVSTRHAARMKKLAEKHGIMVLTNYETTWYPSNHEGFKMISDGEIGQVRKILVYDGHKGPKEINVNPEFLEWLTHPVLNGGGAVIDFGCYGANLVTWILNGQKPESVYASLKQYKPEVYPNVDDDATIMLSYPQLEAVINASWNWPFNRKDMHVYGTDGYILIDDAETIRYKLEERSEEKTKKASHEILEYYDPFAFFAAAITGETEVDRFDLSSLENNLIVVEILEAASKSSRKGRAIKLKK